ncbi:MAG: hypothetical protein ACXADH_10350 [Candidatus Kariarchaeaceae archaeon]
MSIYYVLHDIKGVGTKAALAIRQFTPPPSDITSKDPRPFNYVIEEKVLIRQLRKGDNPIRPHGALGFRSITLKPLPMQSSLIQEALLT